MISHLMDDTCVLLFGSCTRLPAQRFYPGMTYMLEPHIQDIGTRRYIFPYNTRSSLAHQTAFSIVWFEDGTALGLRDETPWSL